MKTWAIVIASLTLGTAFAATSGTSTTTGSITKALEELKASPLSLYGYNFTETHKDGAHNVKGYYNEAGIFIGYKLSDKDSVRLGSHWNMKRESGENRYTRMFLNELRYKRSGILNQAAHGVNVSAELRTSITPDDKIRRKDGNNHTVQARLNVSRDFTDNFSLASTVRFQRYFRNKYQTDGTKVFRTRIYLTPTYTLSDKITLDAASWWTRNSTRGDDKNGYNENESLMIEPGITVSWSGNLSTRAYVGANPLEAHDGQDWKYNMIKKTGYVGLNFDLTAF